MPQITSGSNATFTVPSGYFIDVQCPGGWVQLECPVGTKVFEGNPAGQSFGPYSGGSAKLTSVKGDLYYEVDPKTGGVNVPFDPSNVAIGGGTIADLLGVKLRRLASAASVSNPIINPPLTLPAAWVAATSYTQGTVVTNGGNLYICYAAGTSAGSGGPSGTGAAPIADNTASWHFYGVPRITANSPTAPALTYSAAPAGLTSLYNPVTSPGNFYFAGGTPTPGVVVPASQLSFPAVKTGATGGNCGYNDGTSCYAWSTTFFSDGPSVAIGTNNNNTNPVRIIIDGQYYYDGGDAVSVGNPTWRVLDFSAKGGRKVRRFTVEGYGNVTFAGVKVDPQSKVWAPTAFETVKVAVLGSSIEGGGNSYPILPTSSWCAQLGKYLGWSDVRNLGLGGTGYIQAGSSYTYAQHLADVTAFTPDIVIVGGPINDANTGSTQAQIQAAAVSLFQQIRAALPNAIIIAGGNYPAATGPSAACLAGEAGVLAAVTQFADAKTFFVPIANDAAGTWIDGTGKVTATTGTGNSDVYTSSDGTHPVQMGIDMMALRWATAIRQNVLRMFV